MTSRSLFLLLFCFSTAQLRAAPQPYAWEIVYHSASPERLVSASEIRRHPASSDKIDADFLGFLKDIRLGDARSDPAIRRKAGPVVMLVDCYDRVQPKPPREPEFATLYITRTHVYSDEGRYLKITLQIRNILDIVLVP